MTEATSRGRPFLSLLFLTRTNGECTCGHRHAKQTKTGEKTRYILAGRPATNESADDGCPPRKIHGALHGVPRTPSFALAEGVSAIQWPVGVQEGKPDNANRPRLATSITSLHANVSFVFRFPFLPHLGNFTFRVRSPPPHLQFFFLLRYFSVPQSLIVLQLFPYSNLGHDSEISPRDLMKRWNCHICITRREKMSVQVHIT